MERRATPRFLRFLWVRANGDGFLVRRSQLGIKLRLAARQEHNLDATLLTLGQCGPGYLRLSAAATCVLQLYRPIAARLNAIAEDLTCRQLVGPKTGARVIYFQQLDRVACPVL